ncbi:MAG TPA: YncE family protein [Marmoricola sp.]|jgi:DNA-binding beta-propeller fold protein YncE|nr:YncE family protein [Marmoricola sp.]
MNCTAQRACLLAAAALVALSLAGCGATSHPGSLGAAEPATSPPLTSTPAGTVTKVAPLPQGITYDARTDLLAVAVHDPYRILLLDPTTLALTRSIALPGKARHLTDAAPGGPVLVPDETADELIEVSLPSGSTRVTKVGQHPHNATAEPDGDILVGNEFSHSISQIHDGTVVRTVTGVRQPGGIVVDGDVVAAVDVHDFAVETFDRSTLRRTGKIDVGAGPTHGVLTSGHRMVVADTRGGELYVVGLDPLAVLGSVRLPHSPYGIAVDPSTGDVWVTLTGSNRLVGFSLAGNTPRLIADYPTVRQPDTVAVAPGGHILWVTGTHDGVVQRITR